jgi:hypothetical protein
VSIDWGSAPDWVAAISTSLGLVAAGVATRYAYRQVKHLQQADESRTVTERRSQAERIAAWIDVGADFTPKIMFSNRSDLPVYSVTISCYVPWTNTVSPVSGAIGRIDRSFEILGPTLEPFELQEVTAAIRRTAGDNLQEVLMPAYKRRRYMVDESLKGWGHEYWDKLVANEVKVSLAYVDAAGTAWSRSAVGLLKDHEKLPDAEMALRQ